MSHKEPTDICNTLCIWMLPNVFLSFVFKQNMANINWQQSTQLTTVHNWSLFPVFWLLLWSDDATIHNFFSLKRLIVGSVFVLQHFKSYLKFHLTDVERGRKENVHTHVCECVCVFGCLSLCVVASSKTSHYALGLCSHWHRAPDLLTKIVWWGFQDMKNDSGPKNLD